MLFRLIALTTMAVAALSAQDNPLETIQFEPLAEGLAQPTAIVPAPDGSNRFFVLERAGRIRIVDNDEILTEPFLDIHNPVRSVGAEQGLLGLAFDPQYATNGYFFIHYSGEGGGTVLSRFRVSSDPDRADPASEQVYLTQEQPYPNHNGGQMAFGPDGYLYLGLGDGGSAGDPENRAQNLSSLLGKILRLDVSGDPPAQAAPRNPFASQAGARPEIWAYGLRNPWRFSFDRLTGDLFIGDVGQNAREEIDFLRADGGGENYGWRRMEGSACYNPSSNCETGSLVPPILEYSHDGGECSVTGGYRYRGGASPELEGLYFFGDYCTGAMWAGREEGGAWTMLGPLETGFSISTFGEDAAGELLVADYSTGTLYRFTGQAPPGISEGGVVNGASFAAGEPVAPGSIVSIFGVGFAAGSHAASETPLPTELAGVQVSIGGEPAPLYAVFPQQINAQVPWELPTDGEAEVAVTINGETPPSVPVRLSEFAPALFTPDGQGQAAALVAGTDVVISNSRPARRGEALSLFATGLGPVSNQPATGAPAPEAPALASTLEQPAVTIGGVAVPVLYSGLAPGYAGLYQLNVELTADVPSGAASVRLEIGGRESPAATIAVE